MPFALELLSDLPERVPRLRSKLTGKAEHLWGHRGSGTSTLGFVGPRVPLLQMEIDPRASFDQIWLSGRGKAPGRALLER